MRKIVSRSFTPRRRKAASIRQWRSSPSAARRRKRDYEEPGCNAVSALVDHPEQLDRLRQHPPLIPSAVEETVRFECPIQFLFRRTIQPVTIAGKKIPENAIVVPILGSANRDGREFAKPDVYDVGRNTAGHLAFGLGVHYCLRSSLARLEAQIASGVLIEELPKLRRRGKGLEYFDSFLVRGGAAAGACLGHVECAVQAVSCDASPGCTSLDYMSTASYWFSPAPSEITSSRISLDFGLRAADLFFRELVVPELGRVWFVRQFSWPLASLALHKSLQGQDSNAPKPTAICHGIESLACKLEYYADPQDPSDRILGRRAFGRDQDGLVRSFQRLRQPSNYVLNTHRQAATRAVRHDGGLGFATGARFDLLQLEPVGRAVADAFLEQRVGKGGTSLRNWLVGWLRGERELPGWSDTLLKALSPEHPTASERDLVRSRVLETSTATCETRQHLARAVGRPANLPDIELTIVPRLRDAGHGKQADELVAARAFGAVLDRARDATASLTRAVEPARGGVPIASLARDIAVRNELAKLRVAAKNFSSRAGTAGVTEPTSRAFADALLRAGDEPQAIRFLVGRVGGVLGLSEASVIRGGLFRVIEGTGSLDGLEEGAASIEPDRTGRTFRIANLHSLLRDVGAQGAA